MNKSKDSKNQFVYWNDGYITEKLHASMNEMIDMLNLVKNNEIKFQNDEIKEQFLSSLYLSMYDTSKILFFNLGLQPEHKYIIEIFKSHKQGKKILSTYLGFEPTNNPISISEYYKEFIKLYYSGNFEKYRYIDLITRFKKDYLVLDNYIQNISDEIEDLSNGLIIGNKVFLDRIKPSIENMESMLEVRKE